MTFDPFKVLVASLWLVSFGLLAKDKNIEQESWQRYFDAYQATGTVVILDSRTGVNKRWVYNPSRAKKAYSPASTFKIPHSLFALDAGLVKDEFQVFTWDGVKQSYSLHNQDQNLRSAMRHSAVWVYDAFAKQLGYEKSLRYLQKLQYGNSDPQTEQGSYWIEGNLAISAQQQIDFLAQLHKNKLPFKIEHQLLVKDLLVNEAGSYQGNDWILRAKTGWQGKYGWWVGWVEWPDGAVYFALNIDTPNRGKDLFKRKAIVKDILRAINALPEVAI
ncbi:class D beta-lactamase [Colwellia asteriadis]|uniref:class D beta-lactamase n=1 Tax=Colwellia asteriadis TaxID=517723 RepID=UPI0031D99A31